MLIKIDVLKTLQQCICLFLVKCFLCLENCILSLQIHYTVNILYLEITVYNTVYSIQNNLMAFFALMCESIENLLLRNTSLLHKPYTWLKIQEFSRYFSVFLMILCYQVTRSTLLTNLQAVRKLLKINIHINASLMPSWH